MCNSIGLHSTRTGIHSNGVTFIIQSRKASGRRIGLFWNSCNIGWSSTSSSGSNWRWLQIKYCFRLLQKLRNVKCCTEKPINQPISHTQLKTCLFELRILLLLKMKRRICFWPSNGNTSMIRYFSVFFYYLETGNTILNAKHIVHIVLYTYARISVHTYELMDHIRIF